VIGEALTCSVNIGNGICEMAEVATTGINLGVPVVGEFDRRGVIAGRREKHQRLATLRHFFFRKQLKAKSVPIESQRGFEVGHADHRVQIFHATNYRTCW